ncbi:MAG TPA: glycosyltransferase, partial [Nitrolancea sp.]|nr:glycosyltransferase [Nitrolancea sp.]
LALAGEPFRAVIAGDGPEAEALRRKARTLGVDHRVEFVGRVSDETLVSLYNGARAVYYSPVDEDFGLVTVEAFGAAKPILTAADSGGVLELVRDGETGFVAERAEPDLIAFGLRALLDDVELARRLGERGSESVRDLNWDSVVERLLSNV